MSGSGWRLLQFPLFWLAALLPAWAATNYTIILAHPEQHLVEVRIELAQGAAMRELQLPVWNALYQIRDFSQYVNWIRAKDSAGRGLAVREMSDSLWQVAGAEKGAIVEYEIFADSFGPFGTQFNSHHAFFNLAQVLMYPVDARSDSMWLRISMVPAGWQVATPLSPVDGGFRADNYDRLVDSPVEVGEFKEADFEQGGARYRVIVDAESSDYDMDSVVDMLRKIVASATGWMKDRPFENYMFLYHFPRGPAGGGMEHAYSAAIEVSADVVSHSPELLRSITAHEFFHLWNVKRIRPQGLEPVDYTKENYTRALWFSEGCTSTTADFIELRAGLMKEQEFERQIASGITELERRPAHLTQSAEDSSLDAWLEGHAHYRQPDRSISYYNKGELLGVILDLELREASGGKSSLRELLQWMNDNYAKKGRPFPEESGIRGAAEAVSHTDLNSFFQVYVGGIEEIPWNDFFRTVGLQVVETRAMAADPGFAASRNFDGPMTVAQVSAGSEAEKAGLRIGDVIVEINGRGVGQESSDSMEGLSAGDLLTVKVRDRQHSERELKWKLTGHEESTYELRDLDHITPGQRARRIAWLAGEAQSMTETKTN
jgi:predicted metalloprotease with PDZ domain